MPIPFIPLPYDEGALEPHISAETLRLHHGAHFKSYVDKVNKAAAQGQLADAPLEEIVRTSWRTDQDLFNSAGQAWNHGFYWHSLSPRGGAPQGALAEAIDKAFGSLDACKDALAAAAADHFGSGWAWLVANKGGDKGAVSVTTTHDGETPITGPITGNSIPLLAIDVWEHAYYVDYRNRRPDHVRAVIDNLLDWSFASDNFARSACWTYPR